MAAGRGRRVLIVTGTAVLVVALTGAAPGLAATISGRYTPIHHSWLREGLARGGVHSAGAAPFRSQTLAWSPCIDQKADPGLPSMYYAQQCADMTAPMDWQDPGSGATITIAVSRLPATHKPATGVLFTNPGGPGGSGVNLPLLFLSDGRTAITRSQDVYGMDVRGTGMSSNATCGGVASSQLDPRDRDPANLDLLLDGAQFTARSCDVAGGNFIDLVNTQQTVQDVELLRQVIGAPKVNWLGYSAGTWLGAYYATAFPGSVGHMVLDSNTDFTSTWQAAFELQPLGFERRFREDFLPWAARYDKNYHLGATPEQVEASYERVRAGLTPLRPVDSAVDLDQMLAGAMYAKAAFPLAAILLGEFDSAISAQSAGRVRVAAEEFTLARSRLQQVHRGGLAREPMSADASDATFLAVTCNDTPWSGGRNDLVASSAALGAQYPLIGYSTVAEPCSFWNRPALAMQTPNGVGVPPILMVQSEHDPATPVEGARRAAAGFAGSRLLMVEGEGDHGIYAGGNACVDRAVEAFIVSGTLPAEGATCRGLPMPTPESYGYSYASAAAAVLGHPSTGLPGRGTNPLLALRTIDTRLAP